MNCPNCETPMEVTNENAKQLTDRWECPLCHYHEHVKHRSVRTNLNFVAAKSEATQQPKEKHDAPAHQ